MNNILFCELIMCSVTLIQTRDIYVHLGLRCKKIRDVLILYYLTYFKF